MRSVALPGSYCTASSSAFSASVRSPSSVATSACKNAPIALACGGISTAGLPPNCDPCSASPGTLAAAHQRADAAAPAAAPLSPCVAIAMQGGKLGLLSLTCVVYLVVSGGAYGTEDAVRIAGPRLTLLLCVLVPLTLSIPTALMAAELNALMPVEGGFYFWVKEALGPFWGFAEAYLTLLYTAVDMAIYPVLFGAYLAFLYPLGTAGQIVVGTALVWLAGLLNFLGVRPAGPNGTPLTPSPLRPFAALACLPFGPARPLL